MLGKDEIMKCPLILKTIESQDCIEDKYYFYKLDNSNCKWMVTK